jgi:hypothetical protein
MANIGKAARRPADAAADDVTDLTGASAGQAMDSTPMDSTPGVSRKRHSTGPSLEMPPCSDCRCPLSGPGAVPYAVLSCGCSDRCGSCAGATFLQTLPSRAAPEFFCFTCPVCREDVTHYSVGLRTVNLCGFGVFAPPWQASFQLASAEERQDSVSITLNASASDGSLRTFGGTYATGEDANEPSGELRADLVRICMYIGAILGHETAGSPRCDNVDAYARAAVTDTGLFHQCIRAIVLVTCAFVGGSETDDGVFDATPLMPTPGDLRKDRDKLRETCSIWTIVNIVRKLRNPRMVTGAPGFLSRAVLNHDSSKVASKQNKKMAARLSGLDFYLIVCNA